MKKYMCIAASLMAVLPMAAQETYENAKLTGDDLNGTARYVGMGGAMEALGADISTISTNPAGIGLFRHSTINLSAGLISQSDAPSYAKGDKTNLSFDQAGVVYSVQTRKNSHLNLAFNYHKSKNFNYILAAANGLNNASQNKLTYEKLRNEVFTSKDDATYNQLDHLYINNLLYDNTDETYYYYPASEFQMNREHEGYIADYDFSISGNIHDRVFLGLTFGIKDVNYKHYGEYAEALDNFALSVYDDREISGTGFDVKFGAIFRPIETSPFRIGLYVHTPTWYDLTTSNYTTMSDGNESARMAETYDFKLYTPWKFGLSVGHTINNYLALGATYEYADYTALDTRIIDGSYYDGWDYYDSSSSDKEMKRHTEETLKGVSTLKLGAEYKPMPNLALRLGYNYISPKYENDGFKGVDVYSPGSYYSSATDYTNWKSTNRITCGVGYQIDKFNVDLAYQYTAQKGNFHPFTDYYDNNDATEDNIAPATEVKNNRHQLLLTLGYHF